jgi:endonuclease/exonuclease/phosphatase (EEP) superfamily protein YafD
VPLRAIVAWLLVAPFAAMAVVRLAGLERGWPLVQLVAYTPLFAAGAVVAALAAAILRAKVAALAAAAVAGALGAAVAPRALGGGSDAEGPTLRVLTANLGHSPRAAPGLMAVVRRRRPDVVSLQELTPGVVRALEANGLTRLLPERVLPAWTGVAGNGLFARVPLRRGADPDGLSKLTPAARLRVGGTAVEVIAVHPQAPARRSVTAQWRSDLRALPAATPDGRIRVLAGDFNATLDHAELRRLLATGYEDAADAVGAGLRATWPSGRRFPPPVTIDHVLVDERASVRALSVHRVPRTDHRAVFAELVLPQTSGGASSARIP